MTSFSEKLGYKKHVIVDEAPAWMRSAFGNSVLKEFLDPFTNADYLYYADNPTHVLEIRMLIEEIAVLAQCNVNRDYANTNVAQNILQELLLTLTWYQFYEVVEMIFALLGSSGAAVKILYQKMTNDFFLRARVAWQMNMEGELSRTLPQEVVAIEAELESAKDLGEAAKIHLRKARKFLDDKPCDAPNVVKESVSAIESFARTHNDGSKTLGEAMRALKRSGSEVPPLLISAIDKLYAFACDEAGVRHGNPNEERLMRDDAELVYLNSLAILRYLRVVE
jgi:hypothetical protein